MTEDQRSLYEQLGGADAIDAVVEDFYSRVLLDPELAPFFHQTQMDKLRHMQHEFFAAALGGPVEYSGMDLGDVHAGRGIEPRHVGLFMEHLIDTLNDCGLDADDVAEVAARITLAAQDVTGVTGEDG